MTPRASITAVYGYLPPDLLTNAELAVMVDTSDAWITERTGIKERHIQKGEGLGTSHMAAEAVRGLLQKTGTKPEDVDLLICATTTPDMQFPSTANMICDMVGVKNIGSFDVQAACSGFLYSLTIASQFIANGAARKIHRHQKAGASRMPASAQTVAKRLHYVHQEGAAVYKFAIAKMAEVAAEIMARNNLRADMIDWLVPHQANNRIIESTAERMGLPMDRVMVTIHKYGNTTNATIPLCLWDYEPKLKRGDRLLLAAFGGGFTWAGVYVQWSYAGASAPKLNGKSTNGKGG